MVKEMSIIYARLESQNNFKCQRMFPPRFDEQDVEDQQNCYCESPLLYDGVEWFVDEA